MRISNFKEFNKINEEEGAKENILFGLLSLLGASTMGQTPDRFEKTTKSETISKNLIKQGWTLDSTQVDTLFTQVKKLNPEAEITVTHLNFNKNAYFDSGKFELSQEVKDSISNTMNEILKNEYIVTSINIISSTDKQGLSKNLQGLLKDKGYSSDNKGLSLARSQSISGYLEGLGVSKSIIQHQEMYEEGGSMIDQSARYVCVDIYSIKKVVKNPESRIIKKYYLSKEKKPPVNPPITLGGKNKKTIKLGPIKNFRSRLDVTKCWTPGSHKIEPGGL